ncbi:MAG: VWA domain-containing protein [Vicinamibacterales bacterium]
MSQRHRLNPLTGFAAGRHAVGAAGLGAVACVVVWLGLSFRLEGRQVAVPPPSPQFRTGVDLGHIDVVALDNRRKPVRGLTAADFTLRISGKDQPIRAFAAVDVPGPPTSSDAANWTRTVAPDVQTNTGPDDGRLVVIVFDRSIPPGPKLQTAKRIATAAVNQLGPNDLAAVTPVRSGPVQNFTGDRARLLRAIDGANAGSASTEDEAAMDAAVFESMPQALQAFSEHQACYCNACVLDKIRDIANTLRDLPRPKLLLFVGSEITFQSASAECAFPLKEARTAMFTALDRANVTVHSLDPAGLQTGAPSASSPVRGAGAAAQLAGNLQSILGGQLELRVLPERTGGRVVANTNDPQNFVSAVFAETGSYYVLGFDVPPETDRQAKVEVKATRRGVTVHAQRAYQNSAPPPAASAVGALARTDAAGAAALARTALAGVVQSAGRPLLVNVLPVALPGTTTTAALVVLGFQVSPAGDSVAPPRRVDDTVYVQVAAFDRNLQQKAGERHVVHLAAAIGSEGRPSYDVVSQLSLKPGRYEIRAGTASDDGRTGSVITYVDVPDFRREALSLSGVALSTAPAGPSTLVAGAGEFLPFTPTARRTFRAADRLRVFLQVHEGGSDGLVPVRAQIAVVDVTTREVAGRTELIDVNRFGINRAADLGFEIPLAAFAPGDYLLSIITAAGRNQARRDVRFEVR